MQKERDETKEAVADIAKSLQVSDDATKSKNIKYSKDIANSKTKRYCKKLAGIYQTFCTTLKPEPLPLGSDGWERKRPVGCCQEGIGLCKDGVGLCQD